MYKRADGRAYDELRPIKAKVGVVERADGSAEFAFGRSRAIAAVYGPKQFFPAHLQNPEKCTLRCIYDMASFSVAERKKPGPTRRSQEISYITGKALEPVLHLEQWPNAVIDVFISIIEADASTRVAGINAASMALAHAGIPMDELVAAVSVGKIADALVVDLTKEEEDYKTKTGQKAATDIPLAFLARSEKVSLLQLDGSISLTELEQAIELGKASCKKIAAIQAKALKAVKE